ncbi:MAG: FAD-dependent oxidoreductase [Nitrospinae bacterium]|nr:FAD-dependent oxidoreductase [Nitrospinota bacterium]
MENRYRIMARVPQGQGEIPEVVRVKTAPDKVHFCSDPDIEWYKDNVPCRRACPADTRIPEYIDAAARGDYDKCYEINLMDNVLPHVLGRVCAHPCENACRHGFPGMGDAVSICWLKRGGADYKKDAPKLTPAAATGKKVAIAGSGPAGLALAMDLALWGHKVTIYEGMPQAGGMLRYGIPRFRLPEAELNEEIDRIGDLGVTIKTNRWVGEDPTLDGLRKDYDAVVMAAGSMVPAKLNVPGDDAKGIAYGLDFMAQVNSGKIKAVEGHVMVLGGGYTAMDCSRSALRLGASRVTVVYRRSRNELKVDEREMRETSMEGVDFQYLMSPIEVKKNAAGEVDGVVFSRMRLTEPGPDGRRQIVPVPNAIVSMKCNMVIAAISQSPDMALPGPGFTVDRENFTTNLPKVYAAGDYISGPRDIISAIGNAHKVARAIDRALMGRGRHGEKTASTVWRQTELGSYKEWKTVKGNVFDLIPRQDIPALDQAARQHKMAEVDLGYNEEEVFWQGQRCYLCNLNVQIDGKMCILCYNCVDVCPYNCILMLQQDYVRVRPNGGEPVAENKGFTYMVMDETNCVRCGLCIDACPVPCMGMEKIEVENTFTP